MEQFLQNQLEMAQTILKGENLSGDQIEHWMGFEKAIQRVRLFMARNPVPIQPLPTYNVLVLVDRGGTVEVGTDGLLNVYILDEKDHQNEPTKQEKQFFGTVWDRLPYHRGVDANPPIYDFAQVGL